MTDPQLRLAADGPLSRDLPPMTLGHEISGWVDSVGPGVDSWEVGAPVAVFGGWGCGMCRVCIDGEEQLCDLALWCGPGPPGGFAEYLVVPDARHLVSIGDLDIAQAAPLTDAGLTAYRAVRKALSHIPPDAVVVVIGVGGLGHYAIQFLHTMSPGRIVAIDVSVSSRRMAQALGADYVIDPKDDEQVQEALDVADEAGTAAVLDFVGTDETLPLASRLVTRRGVIVLVGLGGGSLSYSFKGLPPEATITSSNWGNRSELEEVVSLARRGHIRGEISQYSLTDINSALRDLEEGRIAGRAVVIPSL